MTPYAISYARRKAAGLCVKCGVPNSNGRVNCDVCRAVVADANDAMIGRRVDAGLCIRCRQPARHNRTLCWACSGRIAINTGVNRCGTCGRRGHNAQRCQEVA